jgi:hypothetical protein
MRMPWRIRVWGRCMRMRRRGSMGKMDVDAARMERRERWRLCGD